MLGALLVGLPVHAGGALVEDLHAVHAAVALAGVGVAGEDQRQGDEAPAVLRPALQDREVEQREAVACGSLPCRGRLDTILGKNAPISASLGSILSLPISPSGMRISRNSEMRAATSSTESTSSAISILRMLAKALMSTGMRVALGLLEQQRRAAALHGAVGELGDLQDRVHFEGDALQFAVLLQRAR